jgi:hypothetical protein
LNFYWNNIKNYEDLKQLLWRKEEEKLYKQKEKWRQTIIDQIKKGQEETMIIK